MGDGNLHLLLRANDAICLEGEKKTRQGTFLLHWKFSVAVADMAHNQESVQLPLKWSGISALTV